MSSNSKGNGKSRQLRLTEPEAVEAALTPTVANAQALTESEQRAAESSYNRSSRDLHERDRISGFNGAEKPNMVLAGKPKPGVPRLAPPDDAVEAIDAILAHDDGNLAKRRKVLGRHAKAKLVSPTVRGTLPQNRQNHTRKLDDSLGEAEWLQVYDQYRVTAIPQKLAELTGLEVAAVEYLVEIGVKRLNLPAIRVHATRTDVVHGLVKASNPQLADRRHVDEDPPEELEAAITTRAVRESAAAQQCLDAAIDANEIFSSFVKKILDEVRAGNIEVGNKIGMGHLESLTKALSANTAALERAVKLSRLVRGETTDLVGAQINLLLQACSTEELEEAERTGALPRRLVNRFAGGEGQGPRVIDVTEAEPTEPTKPTEPSHDRPTDE